MTAALAFPMKEEDGEGEIVRATEGAQGGRRQCAHDKRQMAVHKDNLPRPSLPSSRRRGHFFAHFGKIDADTLSGAVFQRTRKAATEERGKRREGGKSVERRHTTAYFNGLT